MKEAVGKGVSRFTPGDAVFGVCKGAFAEYTCADESRLVAKPDRVSFEQAAGVPIAALTALQGLRDHRRVGPGQRVLINGAAGGGGSFAVQIAKAIGAEVTGICSTGKVDLVRSIGADHVIDYTRDDVATSGRQFDVLLDCVGNRSLAACRRALTPKGIYVAIGGGDTETSSFTLIRDAIARRLPTCTTSKTRSPAEAQATCGEAEEVPSRRGQRARMAARIRARGVVVVARHDVQRVKRMTRSVFSASRPRCC